MILRGAVLTAAALAALTVSAQAGQVSAVPALDAAGPLAAPLGAPVVSPLAALPADVVSEGRQDGSLPLAVPGVALPSNVIPLPVTAVFEEGLARPVSDGLAPQAKVLAFPAARAVPAARANPARPSVKASLLKLAAPGAPEASAQDDQRPSVNDSVYDGSRGHDDASGRALEPVFEPPTFNPASKRGNGGGGNGGSGGDDGGNGSQQRRPQLSFGNAYKTALMAVDPDKAIYGQMRTVYSNPGSRNYWNQFKKGAEIDVVSKGESVFGRTTKVTRAYTKPIGKLTREDFKGTIPAFKLKAPIRELRQELIRSLEDSRSVWHPNAEVTSLKTTVRVVKFQSFLELYRQTHGKDSKPPVEEPVKRAPLSVKPEGALAPLASFLPRAVFLDLDLFDGPVSKDLVADMAKLQRTGVYFVAFSRKPYAEAGSVKDKFIAQLSSYHLSTLLPIRFMAVTDDGAVISMFPKGGSVEPIDVDAFSDGEMDVLRDAASKAFEAAWVAPRAVSEVRQPAIDEQVDQFPGLSSRPRAEHKDPQVRYELSFSKTVGEAPFEAWLSAFKKRLVSQGMNVAVTIDKQADGSRRVSVRRTSLEGAMPRLVEALGREYGLYLNPNDVLVLSKDPRLTSYNPHLDFSALTGLNGSDMAENALGLLLGEHRDNEPGDLAGSASRIASFTRDRARYLSEILIEQSKDEMQINFFSGHVVHAVNDWLVHQLQLGVVPTKEEYAAELFRRWDAGLRERKALPLPKGESMKGWLRESTARGLSMYDKIVAAYDRHEVLIGTEIPNFFMLKDYERKTGNVKRRYILHTIFDFIALRPDPKKPGHATLVIYDFKTGPAQSRQKLDHDVQVLTYALFANRNWVGKRFPAPYFSGKDGFMIDRASVEFIYNGIKQPTTQRSWDLDTIRRTIISKLNQIHAAEAKLLGEAPAKKKPAKRAAKKPVASRAKRPAKKA